LLPTKSVIRLLQNESYTCCWGFLTAALAPGGQSERSCPRLDVYFLAQYLVALQQACIHSHLAMLCAHSRPCNTYTQVARNTPFSRISTLPLHKSKYFKLQKYTG